MAISARYNSSHECCTWWFTSPITCKFPLHVRHHLAMFMLRAEKNYFSLFLYSHCMSRRPEEQVAGMNRLMTVVFVRDRDLAFN